MKLIIFYLHKALWIGACIPFFSSLHAELPVIASEGRGLQWGNEHKVTYNDIPNITGRIEFTLVLRHMWKTEIEAPSRVGWSPDGPIIENNCNRQNPGIIQIRYWYGVVEDEIFASSAFRVVMTGKLDPCEGGTGGAGGLVDNTFTYTLVQQNGIRIDPESQVTGVDTWVELVARDQRTNAKIDVIWEISKNSDPIVVLSATNGGNALNLVEEGDVRRTEAALDTVWFKSERGGSFEIKASRTVYENGSETEFPAQAKIDVFHVSFVPVSTEIEKIPNIPRNGVLPESLSGTGEKNQVAMQLKVEGPDGYYTFNLSIENGEQATGALSSEQITVQVAHPGGELPQSLGVGLSDNIIVTGGELSSDNGDFVTIKTGSSYNGFVLECDVELLVYEFSFKVSNTGVPQTTYEPVIRNGRLDKNFTTDHIFDQYLQDWSENYSNGEYVSLVQGFGEKSLAGSFVVYTSDTMNILSENGKWANYQMGFGGGVSAILHPPSNSDSYAVLYARTAYDHANIRKAFLGADANHSSLLSDGNKHERIYIANRNLTRYGFWIDLNDAGNSRLVSELPFLSGRRRISLDEVDLGGDNHLGKEIQTQTRNHSVYQLGTIPNGENVFSGKVSSKFAARRNGEYQLIARAKVNAVSVALTIGLDFSFPGIYGMSIPVPTFYEAVGTEINESTAIASFAANMALVIPGGGEYVDTSGEIHQIKNLPGPLIYHSQIDNKPIADTAHTRARAWDPNPIDIKDDNFAHPLICDVAEPMVFKVNTNMPSEISILNSSTVGSIKSEGRNFATAILNLYEVEVIPVPDGNGVKYLIWEVQ